MTHVLPDMLWLERGSSPRPDESKDGGGPVVSKKNLISDDRLDQLLIAADPCPREASAVGFVARPRRHAPWLPAVSVTAVVLVAGGLGAPAIADRLFFNAQTGRIASPAEIGDVPNSEWIDMQEADFVEYAASIWDNDLPVPDGLQAEHVSRALASMWKDNGVGLIQAAGVRGQYEDGLRSLWLGVYVESPHSSAQAAEAQAVLEDSLSWPATRETYDDAALERLGEQVGLISSGRSDSVLAVADEWGVDYVKQKVASYVRR